MTNYFRIWTPRTSGISRTSWIPDFFVSRNVRLLKIIKTDSVINITRAYTEISPKTDKKKSTLLTHQRQVYFTSMFNSQRKSTVFENSLENFIGISFSLDKDSNINVITTFYCSKTPLTIFSSFKTVYRAVKSVKETSIMKKYLILQIFRTARFKIDEYFPRPETFCQLSGETRLCIITTYFT